MGGAVAGQECECSEYQGTAHVKMVKMANFMFSIFYHNKI